MAALEGRTIRVRAGIHTGEPRLDPPKYVGQEVHKAARIMGAGHGGQVLLSQSTRGLVDGLEVRDLGDHRLKDFDEPVRLFQLGRGEFPPLKTLSNTNLPVPVSSFVGRERELADVTSLLRNGGGRLVTLAGPGGSGKTRLAIEAATEVIGDYPDGVVWVGLASVRDPALVADSLGQALGTRADLAEQIGSRTLLVVIDNFEHVIDASVELSALLAECRTLRLLVTSRELLRLQGEVEYQVPPLDEAEAEELFCARSRLPRDDEIADLCRHLDDLPLAVELAAARGLVAGGDPRPTLPAARPVQGRPRRRPAPTDAAGDDRMVVRAPRPAREGALRTPLGLRRWLYSRRLRGDRRRRRRHAAVARRQEPRPQDRRALLDAGDDRPARARAPRSLPPGR